MDLIKLYFDEHYNLILFVHYWISGGLLVVVVSLTFFNFKRTFKFFNRECEINEAELGIGTHTIKIRPNYEDLQIAYKLWVEVSTRKIGLEIDFEHDVIVEIYNSWYEFFKITRELIKDIPARKIKKNNTTNTLIGVAIDVLNIGMRPHLTKWQARFREWYSHQLEQAKGSFIEPQELQKNFPKYDELVEDMKKVNLKLVKYRDVLKRIIQSY